MIQKISETVKPGELYVMSDAEYISKMTIRKELEIITKRVLKNFKMVDNGDGNIIMVPIRKYRICG